MKKVFVKHKKLIIGGLIFSFTVLIVDLIIVPLIINYFYKQDAKISVFEMSWGAEVALNFYGTVMGAMIGAVATFLTMYITLQHNDRQKKEERKLSIKPYLQVAKYYITDLEKLTNVDNAVYIQVSKNLITYQSAVPEELESLKNTIKREKQGGIQDVLEEAAGQYSLATFFQHNYILQMNIQNFGAGNAINVDFQIDNRPILAQFCVATSEPKHLVLILSDDLLENQETTLSFSLIYKDVASLGKYQQNEKMLFCRMTNGELATTQMSGDLLTEPIEI